MLMLLTQCQYTSQASLDSNARAKEAGSKRTFTEIILTAADGDPFHIT